MKKSKKNSHSVSKESEKHGASKGKVSSIQQKSVPPEIHNSTQEKVHLALESPDDGRGHDKEPPLQKEEVVPKKPHTLLARILSFLKNIFLFFLLFGIFILILLLGVFTIFGKDLPDVRKLKNMNFAETTHIYDRKGHELYGIFANENREYVSLDKIDPKIIQATIAIEDKKFYHHIGFDPVGMVRAQLKNFQNENISQGASTITQQLAKNLYLSSERTYERKIKEILLALEIEYFFEKNEILELYFNKLSYGTNAYGIEAAAKTYFGIPAHKVSLVQASILASLPKTPSYYSPYGQHVKELLGYCLEGQNIPPTAAQAADVLSADPERSAPLTMRIKAFQPLQINIIIDGEIQDFLVKKNEEKSFFAQNEIQVYFDHEQVQVFLNEQEVAEIAQKKFTTYNLENWPSLVKNTDGISQENKEKEYLCTSPEDPNYIFGRKDYVLQRMVEDGYITKAQMLAAWKDGKNIKFVDDPSFKIESPHFVFYVREFLEEKYGKELVESGGLRVTTTLDSELQKIAEKSIADHAEKNLKVYRANNAGLVALNPKNGQVLAMVGSRDFWNEEIDGQVNVTTSLRQPGSSFKPLVYAAAIQNAGIGSGSYLNDTRTIFNKNDIPKNYDGKYQGKLTVRRALGGSRNIPAIKAYYVAGEEERLLDFVEKLGLTNLRAFRDNFNKDAAKRGWTFYYGWPMAIGSGEVKLLDLVSAYSVFANQGKLAPPNPLIEVRDRNGVLLDSFDGEKTAKQVIDPEIAYIISDMLRDVFARPAGSWRALLTIPGHNVAAKTGTSNKKIGRLEVPNNDLTLGYTPSLIAGIWVGNSDGAHMRSGAYSLYTSDPIYHQFFVEALKDKPFEEFPKPEGLKFVGKEIFPSWSEDKDKDFEKMFKPVNAPARKPNSNLVPLSDFLRNTPMDIEAAQKMIDKIPDLEPFQLNDISNEVLSSSP